MTNRRVRLFRRSLEVQALCVLKLHLVSLNSNEKQKSCLMTHLIL